MTPGPALEWASRQRPRRPVRWDELEIAAWRDHPRVVAELRHDGPPRLRALLVPFAVGVWPFAELVVTVAGRTRHGSEILDVDTRVQVAALLAALSVVSQVAVLGLARTGAAFPARFVRGHAGLCFAAAVVALLLTVLAGERVDDRWLAVVPMAASLVLGAAVVVRWRRGRARALPDDAVAAVASPGDDAWDAVHADLDRALDELVARKVIRSAQRKRARSAPPGQLAATMRYGGPR